VVTKAAHLTRDGSRASRRRLAKLPYFVAPALLAVVLLLWVRSLLPGDFFAFSRDGRVILVFAGSNISPMFRPNQVAQGYSDLSGPHVQSAISGLRTTAGFHLSLAGFELIGRSGGGADSDYRIVSIFYAYLVLLAAGLSVWSIAALRRASPRWLDGHCRACGYDLRENHDRCPECGAACKAADPAGVSPAAGD